MENSNGQPRAFSDDPEENLRIENEILKLKIQAESGAQFQTSEDLPAEIENEFLQHVQQFEQNWQHTKQIKVYDFLGRPAFRPADELSGFEVEPALNNLLELMRMHQLNLDVLGEYAPEVIYRFITEELFEHEMDNMDLPGWTTHFIYEEFHPNHKLDIKNRT